MALSDPHPDARGSLRPPESASAQPAGTEPATWWTRLTIAGSFLVAAGFGVYLAFASEQADRENAGEAVSVGVRSGVMIGSALFLAGLVALLWDGVRQGRREGRIAPRIAGEIGIGILAMFAGFMVMLIVVHIAFS